MNIIKTLDQLPENRPVVLAFGFFDGVEKPKTTSYGFMLVFYFVFCAVL